MNQVQIAFDQSISEIEKLRRKIGKCNTAQVTRVEERTNAKATALSWYNTHRLPIVSCIGVQHVATVDEKYNHLLSFCEKGTSRNKYDDLLKQLRKALIQIRTDNIITITTFSENMSTDNPPDFSSLISDQEMQEILHRRWIECVSCVNAKAPLAATVMMGGLLETLLLVRIHQSQDKTKIFGSNSAPKDKTGKTLPLSDWTLRHYIDVAHELRWITQTEKDLGIVLRDYRNYIHPFKERSHGVILKPNDSLIIWELTKNISRQLLNTANT